MTALVDIALVVAACFISYLVLLAIVVLRTGTTEGLTAVGAAVHTVVADIVRLLRRFPSSNFGQPDSRAVRTPEPQVGGEADVKCGHNPRPEA